MTNGLDEHRYDDMLELPHHVSDKHPPMAVVDRAVQFSPFAALTGYEAAIQETARLTERQIELGDSARMELDEKLHILREHSKERPTLTITYFQPDARKSGGIYATITGELKRMDELERAVLLTDGTSVPMDAIGQIESGLFDGIDF